jgi:predicted site-specific integrase-resolvase
MPKYRRIPYRPDEEEFVRAPVAAERLGIRTRELYDLVDDGVLRIAADEKGRPVVPTADLEAHLKRRSA